MRLITLYCTFSYVPPVLSCFSFPKERRNLISPVTMAYQKGGVLISGIVIIFFFKINCCQEYIQFQKKEYIQFPLAATYY